MQNFGVFAIRDYVVLQHLAVTGVQGRCKQYAANMPNKNGSENRSEVGPVLSGTGRCSWEELLPRKTCRKAAPAKYPVYPQSSKLKSR